MLEWKRELQLPKHEMVACVTHRLCGDDACGGSIATKVFAVLAKEVFIANGGGKRTMATESKAFGYAGNTLRDSYKRHYRRPFVRILAKAVLDELTSEMESIRQGNSPVETTGNPYRDAARRSLRNHAGGAVPTQPPHAQPGRSKR